MKEKIEIFGYLNSDNICEINLSNIKSRLIQVCGKFTEDYNSDLLIDLESLDELLKADVETWEKIASPRVFKFKKTDESIEVRQYYGFRKNGVDHLGYMGNREIPCEYKYRALYELAISIKNKNITASLVRTDSYPKEI